MNAGCGGQGSWGSLCRPLRVVRPSIGRPRMAGLAYGGSVMEFVAIEAHAHRSDAGGLGHRRHIGDLAVAGLTLYAGFQVFTVRPINPLGDSVNAHPRYGLSRLCQRSEFLNRWFFCRNGDVAGHTCACRRESHQFSWLWICVTSAAFEADRQMQLVAVRDRLHGRGVLGQVVGHLFFCVGRSRQLLRFHTERQE